ncbi:MAG: thiol peroxidase [Candidatus Sericytochromatia bacterium]
MASITLKGNPLRTAGELPAVGSAAPAFTLTGADLKDVTLADFAGQQVVLNIFPSIDTGICASSVRRFNETAAGLANTVVLSVSMDLPFALKRFCGAEGIERLVPLSAFRHPGFGQAYGVTIAEGGMQGLFARAVVVIGTDGQVAYTEQVPEIGQEPDYDKALAALR